MSEIAEFETWVEENGVTKLPSITLPSGAVTISECAQELFSLIGPTHKLFIRGGAVMVLKTRDDGLQALDVLRPAAARSFFEKFGRLFAWRAGSNGESVLKPVTCPQEMAEALLQSEEAADNLPRVRGLINCPVIFEADGKLEVAGVGYNAGTGLLVTGGVKPPSSIGVEQAVRELLGLLIDFDFQSEGDRARAIASLISPALKIGGFLKGRVPADVAEADQSQSGKTYRQKMIAALYNEQLSLISNRSGGVGSIDESLNAQLVAGRPFIQFDNFRGKFDSSHLEAFMTAERSFSCRVPHRGEISVSPENYFIFLTSNGVDTTRDMANRSNIVRIRKRPAGYVFHQFEEGDLVGHVRKRQSYYLGCVFAVIQEWHRQGKPRTTETRHDFREWVQVVDWICQNLFKTVPVMDGHQQAQEQVSNPGMVWLRQVVLAIQEEGRLGQELIASELFELCQENDVPVPGLAPGAGEDKGKKVIGTVMGKLFRSCDGLEIGGFKVAREEKYVSRDDVSAGGSYKSKTYTVTKICESGQQ